MENRFDVIDVHQHLGPYFNFHVPYCDTPGMVAEMDRLGIGQGWIASHAAIEGDAVLGNDDVLEAVRAYPGRFIGYATVDPNYPVEAAHDLERRMALPEFKMIKLHPSLAGYPLDGPNYDCVWSMARARNCPVLTHAWADDKFCGQDAVRRLMEKHPDVHLIFGHALFHATFEKAAEVARDFENLLLDITTSNHCYGMIEHAVETVGADRILFGSDTPFISAAGAVGKVLYARIPDDDKAKIFGGNARRLLAGIRA